MYYLTLTGDEVRMAFVVGPSPLKRGLWLVNVFPAGDNGQKPPALQLHVRQDQLRPVNK